MAASVETLPPVPVSAPDGPTPRKRRKRAPAAGASDDCFTCTTRGARCDRRRPYCSQCLDDGRECSGYKTQLTWGMGVASRGKLRGLSLPVAGTKKLEPPPSPQKPRKRPSGSTPHRPPNIRTTGTSVSVSAASPNGSQRPGAPTLEQPLISPSLPSPYSASGWHTSHHSPGPSIYSPGLKQEGPSLFDPFTMPNIAIPAMDSRYAHPQKSNFGQHTRSASTDFQSDLHIYSASSIPRPLSYLPTPTSATSPFTPIFNPPFADPISYGAFPRPDESYVRNEVHEHPMLSFSQSMPNPNFVAPQLGTPPAPDEAEDVEEIERQDRNDECAVDDVSVYSAPLSLNLNLPLTAFSAAAGIGNTPRMQYLINYYAEVISPVIVAFDGPNNPYRTQILRLAQSSDTLQHAISALAASNLRQRRETGALSTGRTDPARRSSRAHLSLTLKEWRDAELLSPQAQAREETFHKNVAIQSLNQQLADPLLRQDDSILAVLLILCLFHICDSGVAKFQTQFAGVKKLLSLRGHDLRLNTPETKWFTRMFTWFDAMTASVNDREGQLQGHHLDISALSDEEWSLENLAGCDGQLFKIIAKLGRLNILSQGKGVDFSPCIVSRPLPTPVFAANDCRDFDGNGWMRMNADEDLFTSKTSDFSNNSATQFWREWREIRQALQIWQLDLTTLSSSNPDAPTLTTEQRLDLANISESFRYSALLYAERLANPSVPSTDSAIQVWVRHSLDHIKQVKSDVYLLWPLFITGSECVDDLDRRVIRERCLDIQKDSGFLNNKSCLDLIEKIWAGSPSGTVVDGASDGEQGFRFKKVMEMEGNEGEYIVV